MTRPIDGRGVFSLHGDVEMRGPFVVTCEHARNHVPAPWRTPPEDRRWLETHWGYDIGIADVAAVVIERTGSAGVFAEFSRLLCDPNRPWGHETTIRRDVEGGRVLAINAALDDTERAARKVALYDAFHDAADDLIKSRVLRGGPPVWLLSLHSYTRDYLGELRDYDCGVLFDDYEREAIVLADLARDEGFEVRLNEPYSGREGLVYSIQRHGRQHDLRYIEIELRQDVIDERAKAQAVGKRLARALERFDHATRGVAPIASPRATLA